MSLIMFLPKKIPHLSIFYLLIFASSLLADKIPEKKQVPVSFEGEKIFYLSHDFGKKTAQLRAEEATKRLALAIENDDPDAEKHPLVFIKEEKKSGMMIFVRGLYVASIFDEDAKTLGFQSKNEAAAEIEVTIKNLVEKELVRQKWQNLALRFFISVILIFLGVFLLRQLKVFFFRLENFLLKRSTSVGYITVFGVPLIRSESFRGLLAFLMGVLRWLVYVTTVVVVVVSILSQYQITRNYVRIMSRSILDELMQGLQGITLSIPGILLSGLILLCLHLSIHAFNLMLDGIKKQKVKLRSIPIHRIPVFKTLVPLILLSLVFPLVLGVFFQRFDTPLQWLFIGCSLISAFGALPIFANYMCGCLILWRGEISEGDWVRISGHEGEVSSINTMFLHIVPLGGGAVAIPMLRVLLTSIKRFSDHPFEPLPICLVHEPGMESKLRHFQTTLNEKHEGITLNVKSINADVISLDLMIPPSFSDAKDKVLIEILKLEEQGQIKLANRFR